jgi:hypothetical protein
MHEWQSGPHELRTSSCLEFNDLVPCLRLPVAFESKRAGHFSPAFGTWRHFRSAIQLIPSGWLEVFTPAEL